MNSGMAIRQIVVDSTAVGDSNTQSGATGGASNGITIDTTMTTSGDGGIRVEQLADDEEVEFHHSFEESGGHASSSSQLVCSGH